ncbi:hypothetical protein I79_013027 [Cricetulus griseus]|uniref:Uncharacterized protein n=1 Tax=Cricetulus griseus TaxID=10029 RepID=G3HQD0_CRIGR|nr:hypothetical protein I79_013027 [Cricetulus griseus]
MQRTEPGKTQGCAAEWLSPHTQSKHLIVKIRRASARAVFTYKKLRCKQYYANNPMERILSIFKSHVDFKLENNQ